MSEEKTITISFSKFAKLELRAGAVDVMLENILENALQNVKYAQQENKKILNELSDIREKHGLVLDDYTIE